MSEDDFEPCFQCAGMGLIVEPEANRLFECPICKGTGLAPKALTLEERSAMISDHIQHMLASDDKR
jgi:hypothetical protein